MYLFNFQILGTYRKGTIYVIFLLTIKIPQFKLGTYAQIHQLENTRKNDNMKGFFVEGSNRRVIKMGRRRLWMTPNNNFEPWRRKSITQLTLTCI